MYLQLKFFIAFRQRFLEIQVMLIVFKKLKLWFLRRLKDWNTCCCQYHMELKELLNGFNDMKKHQEKASIPTVTTNVLKFVMHLNQTLQAIQPITLLNSRFIRAWQSCGHVYYVLSLPWMSGTLNSVWWVTTTSMEFIHWSSL